MDKLCMATSDILYDYICSHLPCLASTLLQPSRSSIMTCPAPIFILILQHSCYSKVKNLSLVSLLLFHQWLHLPVSLDGLLLTTALINIPLRIIVLRIIWGSMAYQWGSIAYVIQLVCFGKFAWPLVAVAGQYWKLSN